jgi:hypothetical protein
MTDAQKARCKAVETGYKALDFSQARFATFSKLTVWPRLNAGTYRANGIEGKVLEAELALATLQRNHKRRTMVADAEARVKAVTPPVIHELPTYRNLLNAVDQLIERRASHPHSEERGIIVTARAGRGKTTMAHLLVKDRQAVLVQTGPSCGTNYRAPLVGLCTALGLETTGTNLELELRIRAELVENEHVIVFHQGLDQVMSRRLVGFLLTGLLENTKAIVVLLAVPHFMARLRNQARAAAHRHDKSFEELLEQFDRRFDPLDAGDVTRAEVALFLPGLPDPTPVVAAANEFGGLALVASVADARQVAATLSKPFDVEDSISTFRSREEGYRAALSMQSAA